MKKILWVLTAFFALSCGACTLSIAEETASPDKAHEKLEQEAKRNRELLDIWKQHVRTLTQERDEAYKELQQLKAGASEAPMARLGGVETQALPLQAQMAQTAQPPDAGQTAILKKELEDIRAENDRLIQEKERALSQVERLSKSTEGFDLESFKEENKALKLQIQTLKAQLSNAEESSQLLIAENKTLQQVDRQKSSGDQKLAAELQATRAKLQANLAEMKTLKNNFQSYLDSLIAAFEERGQ